MPLRLPEADAAFDDDEAADDDERPFDDEEDCDEVRVDEDDDDDDEVVAPMLERDRLWQGAKSTQKKYFPFSSKKKKIRYMIANTD